MVPSSKPLRHFVYLLRARYMDNFAFVHINKTGGSSIEKALRLPFRHHTAIELRDALGEARWCRRFKFAFVRNPWDKVASHYFYRVKTNQTGLGVDSLEFNEWVIRAYGEHDPRYYDKPKMFMPQVNWIVDENRRFMIDFLGRFEQLQEDFRLICRQLGIHADLPHEKASANRDYRRVYTATTTDVVARWFSADIAAFGYTFE